MRRILFGGLSLALVAFAGPAAGQDPRSNSSQAPSQRVAKLGQPIAVASTPSTDSGVTPVGLLRPDPVTVPTPMPGSMPPAGMPMPGGAAGVPGSIMGAPMVTDDRGAMRSYPTGVPNNNYPGMVLPPGATIVPGTITTVPSVVPDGASGLPSGMDSPPAEDCPTCVPGAPALGRVANFSRWSVSGEYLMWWTRAATVPTLVTTSSPQFNGIPGVGNTTTLVGGSFGETLHSGVRVGAVRWFGDSERNGLEGRMFFLGQASSSFTATTGEYPLLARPFINVNRPAGSFSEVVAAMGRANGGVNVQYENSLWGAEANYRRHLLGDPCGGCYRLDAIVGYRYINLSEKLGITESVTGPSTSGNGLPIVSATVIDSFRTVNQFNGGQIGLVGELHRGRWSLEGRATVAFGDLNRATDIGGGQVATLANGSVVTSNGGLLALPGTNIGHFSDNVFSVIPEAGLNLGYQLTSRLRCFVGYNFLYIGNALRPGDVIDPYVDAARVPNFLPGNPSPLMTNPLHPTPQFRSSGIFIQGVSLGLQFSW